MKALTSLERSKLQLNMMARLHDVFGDVKNEVEITPEFIRDTLAQFMQMATGSNYHIEKSVRVGFGEASTEKVTLIDAHGTGNSIKDALATWFERDKSARVGEVKPVQPHQLVGELKQALNDAKSKLSDYPLFYCAERGDSSFFDWFKPLTVTEKADLVQGITRVIKNHFDKGRTVPLDDLQSVFEAITSLARKEISGIINVDTGKNI